MGIGHGLCPLADVYMPQVSIAGVGLCHMTLLNACILRMMFRLADVHTPRVKLLALDNINDIGIHHFQVEQVLCLMMPS